MALSFPTSPTSGQVYAAPNGVVYTWNATAGVWTGTGPGLGGLGVNQTWQDLTGSRALDNTYTNNTGSPIMVSVNFSDGSTTGTIQCFVNGVTIVNWLFDPPGNAGGAGATFVVPSGQTYSASAGGGNQGLVLWAELR